MALILKLRGAFSDMTVTCHYSPVSLVSSRCYMPDKTTEFTTDTRDLFCITGPGRSVTPRNPLTGSPSERAQERRPVPHPPPRPFPAAGGSAPARPCPRHTWSRAPALTMASSAWRSWDVTAEWMAPATCRASGARAPCECSKNLAAKTLVSAYALLSTTGRGRSLGTVCAASGSNRWLTFQVSGSPGGENWCARAEADVTERDRETTNQGKGSNLKTT